MSSARPSRASTVSIALLALLAFAPGAWAARAPAQRPALVPAAGEIVWDQVGVRARPSLSAPRVTLLSQFRPDFRRRVILAVDVRKGDSGAALWYRISLPGRPNGRTGWVPAAAVAVKAVHRELVIGRGARRLELRERGRVIFRTRVAVGAPGMETPLGLFYVTSRFVPTDAFLGSYAFETSAYSKLSEWPGGGIVGIHGTSRPDLLGQAVSHGCVRVSNPAVLTLRRLVPVGTPIRILP